MKIGVPGGLLHYRYQPFMDTFIEELGAERVASLKSNKKILDKGIKHCVDEACLPIKMFSGHVHALAGQTDAILVPRIMRCEFGESICPKFCALPELTKQSAGKTKQAFTAPLYLNNKRQFFKSIKRGGRELGFSDSSVKKAMHKAEKAQTEAKQGFFEQGYQFTVFLAGHPYNIYDEFINMGLVKKLHQMDIGVITEDALTEEELNEPLSGLIKKPYWLYLRRLYAAASYLIRESKIQGIVYVSSFNCGIDSVTTQLIRRIALELPMLILKIDEQSGEAGFYTRLSAFGDVLKDSCAAKIVQTANVVQMAQDIQNAALMRREKEQTSFKMRFRDENYISSLR